MTADEGAGLGLAFGELQHLGELPALLDVRLLARVALALVGLLALLAVPLTTTLGLDHEDRGEGDGEGNDGGDDHAGPRGGPDVARLLGFCRAGVARVGQPEPLHELVAHERRRERGAPARAGTCDRLLRTPAPAVGELLLLRQERLSVRDLRRLPLRAWERLRQEPPALGVGHQLRLEPGEREPPQAGLAVDLRHEEQLGVVDAGLGAIDRVAHGRERDQEHPGQQGDAGQRRQDAARGAEAPRAFSGWRHEPHLRQSESRCAVFWRMRRRRCTVFPRVDAFACVTSHERAEVRPAARSRPAARRTPRAAPAGPPRWQPRSPSPRPRHPRWWRLRDPTPSRTCAARRRPWSSSRCR